jgi:hypothetical protein
LARRVENPLLRLFVRYFWRNPIEPGYRKCQVTNTPPQLADQVGEYGALLGYDAVKAVQSSFERPRSFSAEVSLGFGVPFINATPRCPKQKIGNVPGLHRLPFRDLRREFVLL